MLSGKTAIVTGGSRGIGAAVSAELAAKGAHVAVVYAKESAQAEAVAAHCRSAFGVKSGCYRCDVSHFTEAKEIVEQIKSDFGSIDVLVNNAGITRDGLIATMKEEDFDLVLDTNLKGAFNMMRHCSGHFIRQRFGRIVNISSVAGLIGNAGQSNYAASKAGIIGLTKSAARELASRNITVNAIAPGFIETSMTEHLTIDVETLQSKIPLRRLGLSKEVAEAVVFLLSANYITGEVLRVDGGMAM